MASLIGWVVLLSLLLAVAGGMYWQTLQGAAAGILAGVVIGLFTWVRNIAAILFPDSFVTYANDTASVVPQEFTRAERVTLVIKVQGLPEKMVHGLSRSELRLIGECVTHNDAYTFSVQHFKDYFKNTETDGYSLYNKSVRWMKDTGALVPNAKGGVDVTDHIGREVFCAMRDEQWEVIDSLPYPTV